MGKLDDIKKLELVDALMKGGKSSDLQKQFGVSKQTITTYKRNMKPENTKPIENKIEPVKEIDENKDVDISQYYDPLSMGEHLEKESQITDSKGHAKIPKSLLNETMKMFKEEHKEIVSKNKKNVKGKKEEVKPVLSQHNAEEEVEDIEDDKKELIARIRQYVFAFNDNKYLNEYIGKDKDKYVLALNKKSLKELGNILEYIQFHVRNKGGSDKFIETGITTLFLIIEKVGNKAGFELDGLTKDITEDLREPSSDLKRAIIELSIEMDTAKYFNSPKVDLLLNLSQKLLFTHQKNKHMRALQPSEVVVNNAPIPKPSVEVFLKSGLDTELKNKYNDL